MNKFWMVGSPVIAATIAAMVWGSGPVRSSENLLSKAQSEFATKARDALIQRQMTQAPAMPTASPAPKALPPEVSTSLEPVAATAVAAPETPVEFKAPEAKKIVVAALETPTMSRDSISAPIASPAPEPVPAPAAEAPAKLQLAALPQEPLVAVAPKPAAAAPVAEIAKAEPPVATRKSEEPRRQYKAERKPRHVQRERRTYDDDYRSDYRSNYRSDDRSDYRSEYRAERRAPRHSTPYNLEDLRSRAPEIAAAIARYM